MSIRDCLKKHPKFYQPQIFKQYQNIFAPKMKHNIYQTAFESKWIKNSLVQEEKEHVVNS